MLKRMRCAHYRAGELALANPSVFNSCIEMGHSWNLKALPASRSISGTWWYGFKPTPACLELLPEC